MRVFGFIAAGVIAVGLGIGAAAIYEHQFAVDPAFSKFCQDIMTNDTEDYFISCTADSEGIALTAGIPATGLVATIANQMVREKLCPTVNALAARGGPPKLTVYDIGGQTIAICEASP